MFSQPQQGTARQQQQRQQQQSSSMCLPAAANAAAMYTATEQMHSTVSGMRAYYSQHQQQQQPQRWGPSIHQQQQQQLLQPPPTAADLSCVVVAVSRLVQKEYGALHGQGECSLRDQVSELNDGWGYAAWFERLLVHWHLYSPVQLSCAIYLKTVLCHQPRLPATGDAVANRNGMGLHVAVPLLTNWQPGLVQHSSSSHVAVTSLVPCVLCCAAGTAAADGSAVG